MGVAEEEHNTVSVPVMAAAELSKLQAWGLSSVLIATPVIQPACEMAVAPKRAHKMMATTTPCHVIAAIHESSQFTVECHCHEYSQVTVDLHESSKIIVDSHKSSQVTVYRPVSSRHR